MPVLTFRTEDPYANAHDILSTDYRKDTPRMDTGQGSQANTREWSRGRVPTGFWVGHLCAFCFFLKPIAQSL